MDERLSITDLMIGDWVQHRDGSMKFKVCEVCLYKNGEEDALVGHLAHTFPDGYHRVHYHAAEKLKPIPVTPEILEKNGFFPNKNYDGPHRTPYVWKFGNGMYDKIIVNLYHPTDEKLFPRGVYHELVCESPMHAKQWVFAYFTFVHELQHALRLMRCGKEIKL